MAETKQVLSAIVEGLQEKKAKKITIVDMTQLEAPCAYFVIAQGESNTQVMSMTTSVKDYVREHLKTKPFAVDGTDNCLWVAMDYSEIIVHIFQPEVREYYDIEHLWNDAVITNIPDLD